MLVLHFDDRLDSGMMMGRSTLDASCLTVLLGKHAAGWVDVPINMVGSAFRTISARLMPSPGSTSPRPRCGSGVRHLEVAPAGGRVVGDQPR